MTVLSIQEIKIAYPNQWVLVGNPTLDDPKRLDSIVNKLISGVVLSASKDRRELAYKAKEVRKGFDSVACIFTGEMPKNRKWLL